MAAYVGDLDVEMHGQPHRGKQSGGNQPYSATRIRAVALGSAQDVP